MSRAPGARNARARWLGVLLILVALAAAVWEGWLAGRTESAAPAAAAKPAVEPSLGAMLTAFDHNSPPATLAAAAPRADVVLARDQTEVCGLGPVKADASGRPQDMRSIDLAARHARERVLPALLHSTDEVTRAAGLLLQSTPATNERDAAPLANAAARDALARMAVATRSAQVYQWALHACTGHRGEGSCLLLSSDQWARLEPDNAMAWMHVAADARERHDTAAVAEALFRVSRATRSEARWGALPRAVAAQWPSGLSALEKGAFASELIAADPGADLPLLVSTQYCAAAEMRDANRQETCLDIAEVLSTRGSTLLETSLGTAIGQRAGWPAERVATAREERDAIAQVAAQAQAKGAWGCAALARTQSYLSDVAQRGEMVALRSAVKQSSDSVDVLAQRWRDAQAQALREANAASGVTLAATP